MSKKKKLKYEDFLKFMETNSKENSLDLSSYDKQSFLDCRTKYYHNRNCWITDKCSNCGKIFLKNLDRIKRITLNYVSFCMVCNLKKSMLEKYHVENPMQSVEIREKIKQTNLKKYNCENVFQNEEIKEKIKKTNLEKYHVENPWQSEEIKAKIRATNLERYNIEYPQQLDSVKEKTKQTLLNNLGVEAPMQSKEIRDKSVKTCRQKYGVDHYTQTEEYKINKEKLMIERYGSKHALQVEEFKIKQHDTMVTRYGSVNTTYKHMINNLYFDSSWELAFYIYHRDRKHKITRNETKYFEYLDDNKKIRHYYPDFKIGSRYYEIKGGQYLEFYKNGKVKTLKDNHAKYRCMKQHHVVLISNKEIDKYLRYVKDTYGNHFLEQHRVH